MKTVSPRRPPVGATWDSPKVAIRMFFCLRGRHKAVNMGMGRNKMAKSVRMLTGAELKYSVTISMHLVFDGRGLLKVFETGRHWKTLSNVRAVPATTATIRTTVEAVRKNCLVFAMRR